MEKINHPSHYLGTELECIEVMRVAFGDYTVADFCLTNAFKYTWRAGRKTSKKEDLDKAQWYLNYVKLLQNSILELSENEEFTLNYLELTSKLIRVQNLLSSLHE